MSMITSGTLYYGEYRSFNDFNEVGRTVTFQADIYSNYSCNLRIYYYIKGYVANVVNIPTNTPGTYSITISIPEDATHVLYRVEPRSYTHEDAFVYTDNWVLTISE